VGHRDHRIGAGGASATDHAGVSDRLMRSRSSGTGLARSVDEHVESSPQICFLLTSRVNDEYLWRELVTHGGYDILAKPLADLVVMQTLQRAWSYWKTKPPPQAPAG